MIKVNILGNTDEFEFKVKPLTKKILKQVIKELELKSKHIVSFIFVDEAKIQEINREYRKIDKVTDVISFAYTDDEESLPYELGDVFICVERLFQQAKDYNHSALRECAFLITHGILHLLGFDHMEKDDEEEMFALQEVILDKLNIKRGTNE